VSENLHDAAKGFVEYIHNQFHESVFGQEARRIYAEDLVMWGGPTRETEERIQQLVQLWFEDKCADYVPGKHDA